MSQLHDLQFSVLSPNDIINLKIIEEFLGEPQATLDKNVKTSQKKMNMNNTN